jgi:hypothetical protein
MRYTLRRVYLPVLRYQQSYHSLTSILRPLLLHQQPQALPAVVGPWSKPGLVCGGTLEFRTSAVDEGAVGGAGVGELVGQADRLDLTPIQRKAVVQRGCNTSNGGRRVVALRSVNPLLITSPIS